ncbi:hypothetical protein HOD88_01865 [archaeon]|jgi:two-component system, NtrC family, sensor kinase|nr:hypothetical protein [archaeon]
MSVDAKNPRFPLKGKYVALVAPSFVVQFSYPSIVSRLRKLGFDKVVELTFGAKLVNKEYHKLLSKKKDLVITSPCPGIVELINNKFPEYKKNLAKIDSPLIAMAKICKEIYPKHKTVFISPCNYKKKEAGSSKYVDYVIDYRELDKLFLKYKISESNKKDSFDKFYNDYTKIYPLSGGLAKTAHLRGVIKKKEIKIIDGISKTMAFLKNPDPKIRLLDVLFCEGGCVGGPSIVSNLNLKKREKKVKEYLKISKREEISSSKKGLFSRAKGILFSR